MNDAIEDGVNFDEIHGVLSKGVVYLVRQNLKTKGDVEEVLFHELADHGGARSFFGKKGMKSLFPVLFDRAGGIDGLRQIAKLYNALSESEQYIPAEDGFLFFSTSGAIVGAGSYCRCHVWES